MSVQETTSEFRIGNGSSNVLFKVDTGADMYIHSKPTYVNSFQDAKLIGLDKSTKVLQLMVVLRSRC